MLFLHASGAQSQPEQMPKIRLHLEGVQHCFTSRKNNGGAFRMRMLIFWQEPPEGQTNRQSNRQTWIACFQFYLPPTQLWESNVFSGVCLALSMSVHKGSPCGHCPWCLGPRHVRTPSSVPGTPPPPLYRALAPITRGHRLVQLGPHHTGTPPANMVKLVHYEAQTIGGSKGGGAGVQILSFPCSFWQKHCKIISIWELAHPPRENPGSATANCLKPGGWLSTEMILFEIWTAGTLFG